MKPSNQKMPRFLTILAIAALVAGCGSRAPAPHRPTPKPQQQQPQKPPRPQTPADNANRGPRGGVCDAQPAQWAVGKKATEAVVEQARVRAGARMARVLHPNQPTTLELNAERLNVRVDGKGTIVGADCG